MGRSEFAARLPNALAFALTALIVGGIAHRLTPGRALAATVIYATSALPFIAANLVTTDTLLTLFETLAVLLFALAWRRLDAAPEPGFHRLPLRLMWATLGLAFLVKGPPGLLMVLPMTAAVAWLGGIRQLARLFDPLGLTVFALVGGSWYVLVVANNPALADYFLVHELYGRIFTTEHHRNTAWYHAFMYLPVLAVGLLPWSITWLSSPAWQWRRQCWRDPAGLLLALWVILPLLVFMLARSRLPLYVLPLAAPLAIASACLQSRDWLTKRRTWYGLALFLLLLLSARVVLGMVPYRRDARAVAAAFAMPPDVQEICFVNQPPQYGLAFYTTAQVESLTLNKIGDQETLAEELHDGSHQILLLVVAPRLADTVLDGLGAAHWHVRSQRNVGRNVLIEAAKS